MSTVVAIPFPWLSEDSPDEAPDPQHASWHSSDSLAVSRGSHRITFAERICVTGLDAHQVACATPQLVRGRDISADGISFKHHHPMPYRYVQVLLPLASGLESVIVRLKWCRYARRDEYISGGYFVRPAEILSPAPADWDSLDEG